MRIRGRSLLAVAVLATGSPALAQAIVADHTATNLAAIPDGAIAQAAARRLMLRHASVGSNIDGGLDALQGQNAKYDRSLWSFEPRGNPGWQAKVDDFVTQVTSRYGSFDVMTTKFCFIDTDAQFAYYRDHLLALEAAHPGKKIVWWTIPIESGGAYAGRQAFNDQVRAYALANGKALFDIAAIESHNAAGAKRTDGSGRELMWPEWTSDGGHLSGAGAQRVASALWWLMARIGGWNPAGLPTVSVSDAEAAEGTADHSLLAFQVSLSSPAVQAVTVAYATQAGTATAGVDYASRTGTVSFAPGQASRTILVRLVADAEVEADETLTVTLTGATGATIADGTATGTIRDDDPGSTPAFTPQYRLYSPVTKEHLYTTDANEYQVLGTRGWSQEGVAYQMLLSGGNYGGGDTVAFYRLYHPGSRQHHWTRDWNEVMVLTDRPDFNYEGVVGHCLPAQAADAVPVYRLVYPRPVLHLWTTDAWERTVLLGQGAWADEGIACYVVP